MLEKMLEKSYVPLHSKHLKISCSLEMPDPKNTEIRDAMSALINLGYGQLAVKRALEEVDESLNLSSLITQAFFLLENTAKQGHIKKSFVLFVLGSTDTYTLLIAVLLSAQCTDKRVNIITPILFKKASTPKEMIKLSIEEIKEIIRPCGLSNNKARAIWQLSDPAFSAAMNMCVDREGCDVKPLCHDNRGRFVAHTGQFFK